MEPDDLLCSRNARPEKGGIGSRQTNLLARRGRTIRMCSLDARSEGQSGDSLGREGVTVQRRKQKALARANGTSREIDYETIGGRAGEKYLPVGGWVRKLRAVEDHQPPSLKRSRASLEGLSVTSFEGRT
jgi:hypothetical protein